MRVAVTGASGFLGRALCELAHRRGHEVVAFSRDPSRAMRWADQMRPFSLHEPLNVDGCEAVIHLAGESILGAWTARKRAAIRNSRIQGTQRVVEGITRATMPPEVLVSASAIGFYRDGGDAELTEEAPQGHDFLAETSAAWEHEAMQASNTRVVRLRTAVVLGRGGGAMRIAAPVFRLGLGGILGSGAQWMSWIHLEDHARLTLFAAEDMDVRGALNASSPWPVRHADFVRALAGVLHRPAWFRIPAFAVRFLLRGLADEFLSSKRVVPAAAIAHGFGFHFPELQPALKDLV